jgi:hypothetical protein
MINSPEGDNGMNTSSGNRQILAILVAWFAATLGNVLLYFVLKNGLGVPFVAPTAGVSQGLSPLPWTDIVIFSTVFSVGAGAVFLAVANQAKIPAQLFTRISIVVLVASLFMPLNIPTPPIPMETKLSLVSFHILGAAILVPIMIRMGLPREKN